MRKLNYDIMKFWLLQRGPLAKEDLCHLTRIKYFTLDKIVRGVKNATELEQTAICKATGFKIDELFPVLENKKESA